MAACVLALGLPSDRATSGRPAHRNLLHAAHRVAPGVFATGGFTMTVSTQDQNMVEQLRVGDTLIYKPSSLFGWLIRIHTGSRDAAHVEVYVGAGRSIASRDRQGVGRYPLRLAGLSYVLRPSVPFDVEKSLDWFDEHNGDPYGFLDLANFYGLKVNGPGMVCSTCAVYFLRAGGVAIFSDTRPEDIQPRDFRLSSLLDDVTSTVLSDARLIGAVAGSGSVPAVLPI